ncbi:MAG: hypothetical protein ACREBE_15175 [bacterium]
MKNHLVLCLLTALTACQLKLEGASCPCAGGWVCCTDRQVCVPDGTSCTTGGDVPGGADGGTDGGTDPDIQQLDLVLGRTGDHFGSAVASYGDVVAIGAPDRDAAWS